MVRQPVTAVREAVGAVDRQVVRRAVRAHAVVEVVAAVLAGDHEVTRDQTVRRQIARAELVVVHHAHPLAVDGLALGQRPDRRRRGRDPHRPRDDVADHARADVRLLVAEVFVAVRRLLRSPAADGRPPARQRRQLAADLRVQRQRRVLLARLRLVVALLVERQVVPDVAAIDDDREVHVVGVVVGTRGQLDRHAQPLELGRRVALEERERRRAVCQLHLIQRRLQVLVDQVVRVFDAEPSSTIAAAATTRSRSARVRSS